MLLLDTAIAGAPALPRELELSLWDLCLKGGPLMIVLALMSVISIYIFIERAIVINRANREDATFMQRIRDYIHEGEIESAFNLCRKNGSPYSRLIAKGISRIGARSTISLPPLKTPAISRLPTCRKVCHGLPPLRQAPRC